MAAVYSPNYLPKFYRSLRIGECMSRRFDVFSFMFSLDESFWNLWKPHKSAIIIRFMKSN